MCCEENNNCVGDLLRRIVLLQRQDCDSTIPSGCDRPFLGPTRTIDCYNTRPISLYNCCTGELWSFTYTSGGVDVVSSIFRVEAVNDNCCTVRILAENTETGTYTNTNEFVTVNLTCVGAVRCLADTFVDLC